MRKLNYNPKSTMFSVCLTPTVLSAMQGDAQYVLQTTSWATLNTIKCDYTGWTAESFAARYKELYNVVSDYGAASFAGGLILMAAVEAAQSLNSTVVVAVMERMHFATVYRNVTYNQNHQPTYELLVQ